MSAHDGTRCPARCRLPPSIRTLAALTLATLAGDAAACPAPFPFLDAAAVVPGLRVEMRYAGDDNFTGRRVPGYDAPRCWLTREAARALSAAQDAVSAQGYALKVLDCYRPARAVAFFVAWARDTADQSRKAAFYPDIDKGDLFRLGYIAARSAHSRGSTVDLTLVGAADGIERDMGTPFDFFGPRSAARARGLTRAQERHRRTLRDAMIRAGFRPFAQEWWHFTLAREPYPDTIFDVPIR